MREINSNFSHSAPFWCFQRVSTGFQLGYPHLFLIIWGMAEYAKFTTISNSVDTWGGMISLIWASECILVGKQKRVRKLEML